MLTDVLQILFKLYSCKRIDVVLLNAERVQIFYSLHLKAVARGENKERDATQDFHIVAQLKCISWNAGHHSPVAA